MITSIPVFLVGILFLPWVSVRLSVRPFVCSEIVYAPYREDWSKVFHETLVRCSPQQGNVQNECLDHTNWLNFSYILDFKLKKKRKHGKRNANGGDLPKKKSGTMRGKTDNHKGKPTIQSIDDILKLCKILLFVTIR